MKRRLNILCAVVLLVMGWSVGVSLYYMGLGMTMGVQMGMDAAREMQEGGSYDKLEEINNLKNISLLPKFLKEYQGDFSQTRYVTKNRAICSHGLFEPDGQCVGR